MMALASKVFGAGANGLLVQALCMDVLTGITATGANQATAYPIANAYTMFNTVALNTGAILPTTSVPGDILWVYNMGAQTLNVYPPVGAQILGGGTNNPFSILAGLPALFVCFSSTEWAA